MHANAAVLARRQHEEAVHRTVGGGTHVDLDAVGVDVVRLVVQSERRRRGVPDPELGLPDVHADIDAVLVPVHRGGGGELLGARIWLLASAVLVLVIELQRLGEIEAVEPAVERGRIRHAEGHAGRRRAAGVVDERSRGLGGLSPETAELDRGPLDGHVPPVAGVDVPLHAAGRLHLDEVAAHPPVAHDRCGRRYLDHRDQPHSRASRALQVEHSGRTAAGQSRRLPTEQLGPRVEVEHQPPAVRGGGVKAQGAGSAGHEALQSADELAGPGLIRLPSAGRLGDHGVRMPRQLDRVRLRGGQLDHVEEVARARHQGARELAPAAARPGPVSRLAESRALRVGRRLGGAVETRRVVRQGGAIPEEVASHVRAGPRIGQPMQPHPRAA